MFWNRIARVTAAMMVLSALASSAAAQVFEQCAADVNPTCRTATRGTFSYTDKSPDPKDRLAFTWLMGESTTFQELGDPTTTADYRMCVFAGGNLISQAIVPAAGNCGGKPCWEARPGRAYNYKDAEGLRGGLTVIRLAASDDDMSSVKLKGKGTGLYDVQLPFAEPVVVEVHNASNGVCFTFEFSGSDILLNSDIKQKFRARQK